MDRRSSLIATVFASVVLLAGIDAADAKPRAKPRPRPQVQLKVPRAVRTRSIDAPSANQPSVRYAGLSVDACRAELSNRKIRFDDVASAPGVLAPVRLPEGIGGVLYRTDNSPQVR